MSSVTRKFSQAGTVKTFSLALDGERNSEKTPYLSLVAQTDDAIINLLPKQNKTQDSVNYGGFPDPYIIYTTGATGHAMRLFGTGYCTPESRFFQSEEIAAALEPAISFMLQHQHEDGTIDLHSTNFHSTPDTAFRLDDICATYTLLQQADLPEDILKKYKEFILKAADALTVGGIHTPNHRWVTSRSLARVNSLFPNPKYLARMEQWLAEGIDSDADGQYNERSTAIYTPLTNRCFIEIARLADKPELLDNVRKNLDMSLHYMHPDGEVVTEASRRQDNSLRFSMGSYYYPYLWMAHHDQNGRFAAMAEEIVKTAPKDIGRDLIHFLEEPGLFANLPATEPLPTNYEKEFSHSNLVRIRREEMSATILAQTPAFFTLHKGAASLTGVRLASAFFGKGQFESDTIDKVDGKYILKQTLTSGYYQPIKPEKISSDGDWDKMPQSERDVSELQELNATVTISEKDKTFALEIEITGTEHIPVAVEMTFRGGGTLHGVDVSPHEKDSYLLRKGTGEYHFDGQCISFGPGGCEHEWTQLRGADAKLAGDSVYLTGTTPYKACIIIR